jgi:hypothetical protein
MDIKEIENLPIINLLNKNNIHYKIKFNFIKLTLYISSLNIFIYKYHFSNNYYVYYKNKFIKKIEFL